MLGRTFPAPEEYYEVDIGQAPEFLRKTSWFARDGLDVGHLFDRYETDGWLCGGIPMEEIHSPCWRTQYACSAADFHAGSRTANGVRADFSKLAMNCFNRLRKYTLIDSESSGMFIYRTRGEVEYLTQLNAIPTSRI